MAFDYKKEYREFYLPPKKPQLITIPPMNFVAVQGRGDASSNSKKIIPVKSTKDVAFGCEMCYTKAICKSTHATGRRISCSTKP